MKPDFMEILGKLSVRKQCVPGSLFPATHKSLGTRLLCNMPKASDVTVC